MRPTSIPVRAYRCLRLAFHFLWIAAGAALIYPCVGARQRARLKQRWSHQILRILAIHLDLEPTDAPSGSLIVANHVSWLDIFVINALRPSAFVSKSEVRMWPFIGWLAEKNDTVFLRRGSRGHAKVVNEEIDGRLNSGQDVAIFPEGTTTDGTHLLGFHAALLQPAVETGRPVLPLAISYHDANGEHTKGPAFVGEATLIDSFAAILSSRSLIVHLTPSTAIDTTGKTRREVVHAAHEAIAAALTTRLGFPPASTAPGKPPDPPA
ncbi:MAG: lysophospholipid acyltransferase family protein [Propionivibrio sp.]